MLRLLGDLSPLDIRSDRLPAPEPCTLIVVERHLARLFPVSERKVPIGTILWMPVHASGETSFPMRRVSGAGVS